MQDGYYVKLEPKQIQNAVDLSIREAVAEVLGKDPDALVKAVVDAALKPRDSYGRPATGKTPFETAVDRMIHDEATEAVKELVDANRLRIRETIKARVAEQWDLDTIGGDFADSLIDALKSGVSVYGSVKIAPIVAGSDDPDGY
jgi:hypothetical protein